MDDTTTVTDEVTAVADDVIAAAAEVSAALRRFGALRKVADLMDQRLALRREVRQLTDERDLLRREIGKLRTDLKPEAIGRQLRRMYAADIKARLREHGVYPDHTRLIDERLFFMAFDEIVGMSNEAETKAVRDHVRRVRA